MATVVKNMKISSADPESESGLGALHRRVLYKLVWRGELMVRTGDQHDYDLASGLSLSPAVGGEIADALRQLIELGLVTRSERVIDQQSTNVFGSGHRREVVIAGAGGEVVYRPVFDADTRLYISSLAAGRPVLAWLYIYGPLEYVENLSEDGVTCYKSRINEPMGEPDSKTDTLRADAERLKREWLVDSHMNRRPARWRGSHGQMHDLIETHVILELNK